MPRLASWSVLTPMGGALASLAALTNGSARPGRLAAPLVDILIELGRSVVGTGHCDLVLLATTKADLPRWLEAITVGSLEGGPADLAARLGTAFGCPGYAISAACASGPIALAEAARALRHGGLRRILVVGGDCFAPFIEAGFAGLGAVDPTGCHPFDAQRAGIALGETAAAVMVEAGDGPGFWLQGWGQTLDASHLTAPARDGVGLQRACMAALALSGVTVPGLVIAHGTGTRANDAAELACYRAVAPGVPITAWKGGLGHSLGPSGLTEVAIACAALAAGGAFPGILGLANPGDPEVSLLGTGHHRADLPWLSPNAGFGGINGCVVIGAKPPREADARALATRVARITAEVFGAGDSPGRLPRVTARQVLGQVDPTWGRMDGASRLLVALGHRLGPWPAGSGIVLATDMGCQESDARFEAARQAGTIEPQTFAYTLPSAPLGEASIRLALTGPGQVLLGANDEALRASARWLLAEGAPAVLVARIDTGGPVESAWAERWQV